MKTNLFLVRHGQTQWNLDGRVQGQLDSSLTKLGKGQAKQVRKRLLTKNIHIAYSSPLYRAVDTTALIINNRPIKIHIRQNLSEIHQGSWQGLTYKKIQQIAPEELDNFMNKPTKFFLPGAESFLDFYQRVISEITHIFNKHKGKNILVVSHGIVIKAISAFILHQSLTKIPLIPLLDNGDFICLKQNANDQLVIS
ncbi:MAG: histidine phosphatase family protein [Pseudomonadota bacterium]